MCVLCVAMNIKCCFYLAKIAHLNEVWGQTKHNIVLVLASTVGTHNHQALSRVPFS
jgi:hypothetical protein